MQLRSIGFTAGVVYAFGGVLLTPSAAQTPLAPEQQVQAVQAPPDDASASALPAPAPFVPLTLGQKYLWSANKVFSPGSLFLYNFRAGFDEVLRKDSPWGNQEDSYGVRTASFLGRSFLRQNLAFGVRAFDHEDPRYFVLGRGSRWTRVKYAVIRTFLVRNDSGGIMPAYSLFTAAFGTPLLADQWGLEHRLNPHPLRAGGAGLGIAVGSDVFQEFWPDIKRKLGLDRRLHGWYGH
jgi:hypothetical protein